MALSFLRKWMQYALAAALLAAGTASTQAQQNCGPHGDLVAHLGDRYQERQLGYGTVGNFAIMEIYVSDTGTWTVIVTDVAGKSCIVAAGEAWETTIAAILPGG
jgi:hypothetical protein